MTTLELWDEQGNLFSVVDQPWPAQSALYTTSATTPVGTPANTEQVYAASGSSTTGHDTRGFGYVDIQASRFTWQSSNNATYVIPDAPDSFPVSLARMLTCRSTYRRPSRPFQ